MCVERTKIVTSSLRRFACILCILACTPHLDSAQTSEASRVRVLIAVDTDDQMGATWGLDGANLKSILSAAFEKQGLTGRVTIDKFTGKQMTTDNILGYYENLQPEASEALVFYYSGHGGHHLTKGHYLAMHSGQLYRSALLAAMQKHKPRLVVVLTDCCANLAGGARPEEPPGATIVALSIQESQSTPKAKKEEPPTPKVAKLTPKSIRIAPPPRPNTIGLGKGNKAKKEEPPSQIVALRLKRPLDLTKAKQEEPPAATVTAGNQGQVTLRTGDGALRLDELAASTDGEVLRHLFFRHQGVVDINGCQKGALSHGTLPWGGSLFTIGFLALQKENVGRFDANGNRLVEWSEFFPALQKATDDAAKRSKVRQTPEATQLGQPTP
jgi:hypothetical protein